MMVRRGASVGAFLLLVGLPLLGVLAELFDGRAWEAWHDYRRWGVLLGHTTVLVGLTILMAGPLGLLFAFLLERTNVPGRRFGRAGVLLGLFVPLPLTISAWQAVWGDPGQPWYQGILWAAFVHAVTALPWVVWLLGLGFARVEPELEEDALTVASPWRVLWFVTLPRMRPALGFALLWIVLQTGGEIAVTDMANVRTFAEEVYTQYVVGGPDSQGRAVMAAIPFAVLSAWWCHTCLRQWNREPPVTRSRSSQLCVYLGRGRWLAFVVVLLGLCVVVLIPVGALVWQAGTTVHGWHVSRFRLEMQRAFQLHTTMIAESLAWALLAGVLVAGLALACGGWLLDRPRCQRWFFLGVALLWAMPGPVLGFGLKEAIARLMDVEDVLLPGTTFRPCRALLYEWSTPLPVLWAYTARFLPIGVAVVWPALWAIPRDLRDAFRMESTHRGQEFRHVLWPHTRRSCLVVVVVVTALALGELSTSKLVQVPGRQTFAQELFNQMHYGVTTTTAALALVQWTLVLLVGAVAFACTNVMRRS